MRINELIAERGKAMVMEADASRKDNDDSDDSDSAANSSPFLARLRHSGYLLPSPLTGYFWLKGWHPNLHLPGFACPLRVLSGIPCPTCFLTRATCVSLSGQPPSGDLPCHQATCCAAALDPALAGSLRPRNGRLGPLAAGDWIQGCSPSRSHHLHASAPMNCEWLLLEGWVSSLQLESDLPALGELNHWASGGQMPDPARKENG